jgi:uncharacterized protein YjbJ (UPF0337 family)
MLTSAIPQAKEQATDFSRMPDAASRGQRHEGCSFCRETARVPPVLPGTHRIHPQKSGTAMNKDEIKGKAEQVKGKIKQGVGEMTDDVDLQDEGAVDEAAGKLQEGWGTTKRKTGEAVEDLGNAIKK